MNQSKTLEQPHAGTTLHQSGIRRQCSCSAIYSPLFSQTHLEHMGRYGKQSILPVFSAPAMWNRLNRQRKLNNLASQRFWKLYGN